LEILKEADEESFIIMDELGSGTDPARNAAAYGKRPFMNTQREMRTPVKSQDKKVIFHNHFLKKRSGRGNVTVRFTGRFCKILGYMI
jgi:hypothetical protein